MSIILTSNSMWNISHFRLAIIKSMLAAGHEVIVLAPFDGNEYKLKQLGVKLIHIDMQPNGQNPLNDIKLFLQLRRILKLEKPTHVFSFTIKNNIFGALAARGLNLTFTPNITGLGTIFLSGKIKEFLGRYLHKIAFRGLDQVFFQNEDDARFFLTHKIVRPGQVRILPGSGIDLKAFNAQSKQTNQITFLMISRLIREKGVYEYVEAARSLKKIDERIKFQLMGPILEDNPSGLKKEELDNWITEGVIEYLGVQPDVRPQIKGASCIVLPSYREGAPRILIEASAMSRPCITSDVPGCRSVVEDNITGFLTKPYDSYQLALTMLRFVEMSSLERVQMGVRARQKMELEYNEARVIREYNKILTYHKYKL